MRAQIDFVQVRSKLLCPGGDCWNVSKATSWLTGVHQPDLAMVLWVFEKQLLSGSRSGKHPGITSVISHQFEGIEQLSRHDDLLRLLGCQDFSSPSAIADKYCKGETIAGEAM